MRKNLCLRIAHRFEVRSGAQGEVQDEVQDEVQGEVQGEVWVRRAHDDGANLRRRSCHSSGTKRAKRGGVRLRPLDGNVEFAPTSGAWDV
mmetsp:Transcript_44267/g.122551  ORF Transcript_44267/g.122551 Transcript_44267/m.122551 type:complete len:90 (+) Transcript_44267:716-985(+)